MATNQSDGASIRPKNASGLQKLDELSPRASTGSMALLAPGFQLRETDTEHISVFEAVKSVDVDYGRHRKLIHRDMCARFDAKKRNRPGKMVHPDC